jgi:hypothetical protein
MNSTPPRILAWPLVGLPALSLVAFIWLDELAKPYAHQILSVQQATAADGTFFDLLTIAVGVMLPLIALALAAGAWQWKPSAVLATASLCLMSWMLIGICLQRWQIYTNGRDDTSTTVEWLVAIQKMESEPTGKSTRHVAWIRRSDSAGTYRMGIPAEWIRTVRTGQELRIKVRMGAHGKPWLVEAPVFVPTSH